MPTVTVDVGQSLMTAQTAPQLRFSLIASVLTKLDAHNAERQSLAHQPELAVSAPSLTPMAVSVGQSLMTAHTKHNAMTMLNDGLHKKLFFIDFILSIIWYTMRALF